MAFTKLIVFATLCHVEANFLRERRLDTLDEGAELVPTTLPPTTLGAEGATLPPTTLEAAPDCPDGTNLYELALYDYEGDGWEGAEYVLSQLEGFGPTPTEVARGTLAAGSEQVESLCLEDGTYSVEFGGGSGDAETGIQWLPDDTQKITSCLGPCTDYFMMVGGLVLEPTAPPTPVDSCTIDTGEVIDTPQQLCKSTRSDPEQCAGANLGGQVLPPYLQITSDGTFGFGEATCGGDSLATLGPKDVLFQLLPGVLPEGVDLGNPFLACAPNPTGGFWTFSEASDGAVSYTLFEDAACAEPVYVAAAEDTTGTATTNTCVAAQNCVFSPACFCLSEVLKSLPGLGAP